MRRAPIDPATFAPRPEAVGPPVRLCSLALAVVLAVMLAVIPAMAQDPPPDPDSVALWQRLEIFLESAVEEDFATLDEVTCLDDLLHAQLVREEALGLIGSAVDPALVAARKAAAREQVRSFVDRLLDRGVALDAIDLARIEDVSAPDPRAEEEVLVGEAGEVMTITASGTLGIHMLELRRPVDLNVYRLRDSQLVERWCLDPLSVSNE